MAQILMLHDDERKTPFLENQTCIRAIKKSDLSYDFKKDLLKFAKRNIIPECGRVSPNCLKAYMIKKAKLKHFRSTRLEKLKNLFRSKIGYKGYFLDAGKLNHI
jgi:hypothetical protein